MKTKIVAAALLMAAVTSPAFASDSTVAQYYANSGTYFNYLGNSPRDAFAQANGEVRIGQPRFTNEAAQRPVTLQMQRWYDRQSEIY